MGKRMPRVAVIGILLLSVILMSFGHEVEPAFHKHAADDYHTLIAKGQRTLDSAITWVQTGKDKAVIFAQDYEKDWNDPRRIYSALLKAPNKVKKAVGLLSIEGGRCLDGAAITFENANNISPSAKGPVGLLFIVYQSKNTNSALHVAVAPFDAKGKKTAEFKVIRTIQAGDFNLQLSKASLYATCQDDRVAVVVNVVAQDYSWPAGIAWTKTVFMETDLSGSLYYLPTLMNLPGNGAMMDFEALQPAWYAKKWFIPARAVMHEAKNVSTAATEAIGSRLFVISAKPRGNAPPKFKFKLLEEDDQTDCDGAFHGVQFIPTSHSITSPAALDLDDLYLIYQKRTYHTATKDDPIGYKSDVYVRMTKKNGNAKKAKLVKIPMPKNAGISKDVEYYGNDILSRFSVTSTGKLLFQLTRYREERIYDGAAPSMKLVNGWVSIFSFSPASMAAELMWEQIWCPYCWMDYTYYSMCIWFGGYYGYMYAAYEMGEDYAKALVAKMVMLGSL